MHIEKLALKNFKRFRDSLFDFNSDINILVGDNASGKSSLLEAIDIVLNKSYRGQSIDSNLTIDLFNNSCTEEFVASDKTQDKLPEILVEAYLVGCPEHKGNKNTLGENRDGLFVRIAFNDQLGSAYADFLKENPDLQTIPIEFYQVEWFNFGWKAQNSFSKQMKCLFVDPPRLHPNFGSKKYISDIVTKNLEPNTRSLLNLNFRRLKQKFDEEPDIKKVNADLDSDNTVTDKDLQISVDFASKTTWENNLQLNVDDVPFSQIGKGEQHQIQIKLALWQKAKNTHVVMIEEPENHLSHMNLVKLVDYIEGNSEGQQVFVSTHSSYVLNKLSFEKICLLADGYKRLSEVDSDTVKTLKRLPGYDTLRIVLCSKVILVEGPSDELLLKKIYLKNTKKLPEADGIDIIVVRGIGFRNYLNIVRHLGNKTHVVKDNDHDYAANINSWKAPFEGFDFIKVFSPEDNNLHSLEPALIEANSSDLEQLNKLAAVVLGPQVFADYSALPEDKAERQEFLRKRYQGNNSGAEKVSTAMRIFDSAEDIIFPDYLKEALDFGD
ncbi:ATP-dependent nuclease [Martelella radicis]|uniref:Putative ATPase n=1 Tax=Martelella radicis TaxID=1397476 RepID=A0A7W6KML3_9HYPH|nr:AAA family ATPase [Martelella radicis]MBB4123977.1 putative ATPase [Martelella radicis]